MLKGKSLQIALNQACFTEKRSCWDMIKNYGDTYTATKKYIPPEIKIVLED